MKNEANNEMTLRYYRAIRKPMDEAANEAGIGRPYAGRDRPIRAIGAQPSEEVVP